MVEDMQKYKKIRGREKSRRIRPESYERDLGMNKFCCLINRGAMIRLTLTDLRSWLRIDMRALY